MASSSTKSKSIAIATSALTLVTAASKSANSLNDTVQRFKRRNKILNNLHDELSSLASTLDMLKEAAIVEPSMLELLKGPVERCCQVCDEFKKAMEDFHAKSKIDLLDWAKMEFMKGNVSDFMETLAGYKATILVVLGTINLKRAEVSRATVERHREMIKDTTDGLMIQIQRLNERVESLTAKPMKVSDMPSQRNDEAAVTERCIHICHDAKSFVESLEDQEPIQQNPFSDSARDLTKQFLAGPTSGENEDNSQVIYQLRKRLESLLSNDGSESDRERLRFQKDLEISREFFEVCRLASQKTRPQNVFTMVEAIAEGESDQVIVTTSDGLFDVKKAFSRGNSAQLIGSMTSESVQQLSHDRYGSKFGIASISTPISPKLVETRNRNASSPQPTDKDGWSNLEASRRKPAPNEMRKRAAEVDTKTTNE